MPNGKPAGVACIHLQDDFKCAIFNKLERPDFCGSLKPSLEMCGDHNHANAREYAIAWLSHLEQLTKPDN